MCYQDLIQVFIGKKNVLDPLMNSKFGFMTYTLNQSEQVLFVYSLKRDKKTCSLSDLVINQITAK